MSLALDPDGTLPPGPNPASIDNIYDLFVNNAPAHSPTYTKDRQRIWHALLVWIDLVHRHFGPCQIWLAGTFVSHQSRRPVLRVLIRPRTPSMIRAAIARGTDGLSLITLDNVIIGGPVAGGAIELRPVGGMLDTAIDDPDDPAGNLLWQLDVGEDGRWVETDKPLGYVVVEV